MRVYLIFVCFFCWLNSISQSDSSWFAPERMNLRAQFAGYQGMGSIGSLLDLRNERIQLGLMYGFAPSNEGEHTFHGITLRATGSLRDFSLAAESNLYVTAYASISGMYEIGGTTFFFLPDEYPRRYYYPQALHGLLGLGLKLKHKGQRKPWAFTAETVALDTYLWYAISQKQIDFHEAWSLALGFECYPFKTRNRQ